jgi:hypothetical protein
MLRVFNSVGRKFVWQTKGCWFKSSKLHHMFLKFLNKPKVKRLLERFYKHYLPTTCGAYWCDKHRAKIVKMTGLFSWLSDYSGGRSHCSIVINWPFFKYTVFRWPVKAGRCPRNAVQGKETYGRSQYMRRIYNRYYFDCLTDSTMTR